MKEFVYNSDLIAETGGDVLVNELIGLTLCAAGRDYKGVSNYAMDQKEYFDKSEKWNKAFLAYAASKSGIKQITEKKHLANAVNGNTMFVEITNAIIAETLAGVMPNILPAQVMNLCNIEEVDLGNSYTWEIETKGIPVAQRTSYGSNVTLLDTWSKQGITITPKQWTTGSTINFERILANGFDMGKEMARVAMSLMYAQYKLVVGLIYDTATVTGTPFYQASFVQLPYTTMISDLQAVNGTGVMAMGTLPAFQKMSAVATTNFGFESQDEVIRNGFLGRAYGITNYVIDQATDLSAEFTTGNAPNLRLVPNDRILLLAQTGDKPVKLVRENFVRVISKDAKAGSLFRQEYSFTMSFDAALATQAHYGIQGLA